MNYKQIREQLTGKKVLFANVPADGHFYPLTGIASYLHQAGCDVRWFASSLYAEKIKALSILHYPLIHAFDINGSNITDLVPEIRINDPVKRTELYRIQYAKYSIDYYRDIEDIYRHFRFDLLIADSLFSAIPFVKHKLRVPVLSIGVVPLAEDSVDTAPYGLGLPPPATTSDRARYAILYQEAPDRYKQAAEVYESLLRQEGVPYERAGMENILIKAVDLYLQIGTPGFEYRRRDIGPNIRFAGPLPPFAGSSRRKSWFDNKINRYSKIVLVTQGTIETDTGKLIEPALEAFIGTNILIIVTTGGRRTEELNEKFGADNVIIEDFIPFTEVLPYASVYITNGGYGGTVLSIMNRVPILAAGLHEGKNEVCARIGYFNIGIDLRTEMPSSDAIRDGVNKLLADPVYKKNISRLAAEFQRYSPVELVAGHVAAIVSGKDHPTEHVS